MSKRLLLLSNSKNYQMGYLEHAKGTIKEYLGDSVKKVLFVPFAGVTVTWDDFTKIVAEQYNELGYEIVHHRLELYVRRKAEN